MKDKQKIEESKAMWELEKSSMPPDVDRYIKLIEILDPLINSGKVLYIDFVKLLTEKFEEQLENSKSDTKEDRKKVVDAAFNELIAYYKQLN